MGQSFRYSSAEHQSNDHEANVCFKIVCEHTLHTRIIQAFVSVAPLLSGVQLQKTTSEH